MHGGEALRRLLDGRDRSWTALSDFASPLFCELERCLLGDLLSTYDEGGGGGGEGPVVGFGGNGCTDLCTGGACKASALEVPVIVVSGPGLQNR